MDLNNIKDQVSNLTLYDLKAGVRKVQNGMSSLAFFTGALFGFQGANDVAVMNYTEMEAKVCLPPGSGFPALPSRSIPRYTKHAHGTIEQG